MSAIRRNTLDFIIQPQDFVKEMEAHWTNNLKNTSSSALRQVWDTLASTFGFHIAMHGCETEDSKKTWTVLQPECGTGKTQGAVVFCKMLSELPKEEHPGVLIVTRLTDDCDSIAEQINQLSDKDLGRCLQPEELLQKTRQAVSLYLYIIDNSLHTLDSCNSQ